MSKKRNIRVTPSYGTEEGIIAEGILRSENDFIDWYKDNYEEKGPQIQHAAQDLLYNLYKYVIDKDGQVRFAGNKNGDTIVQDRIGSEEILKKWEVFKEVALGGMAKVSIQVGYRKNDGKYTSTSYLVGEDESMRSFVGQARGREFSYYGISTQQIANDMKKRAQAKQVEMFLLEHLNDLVDDMQTTLTRKQIKEIWNTDKKKCLTDTSRHMGINIDTTWMQAFVNRGERDEAKASASGKVYEAYFRHLANQEGEVYRYLQTGGLYPISGLYNNNRSVFWEEGVDRYTTGNMPYLLQESKGNTSWFSSGDITIINSDTKEVVYNIQLKTTNEKAMTNFGLSAKKLADFLKTFTSESVSSNVEKAARLMYETFKTTAIKDVKTSDPTREDAYNLTVNTLEKFGVKKA